MNSNLFPMPFNIHVIFCAVAAIFFIIQFIRQKRLYQLIMAIIIPVSMLIYLNKSKTLYNIVGLVEFIGLISAIVVSRFDKKLFKGKSAEKQ